MPKVERKTNEGSSFEEKNPESIEQQSLIELQSQLESMRYIAENILKTSETLLNATDVKCSKDDFEVLMKTANDWKLKRQLEGFSYYLSRLEITSAEKYEENTPVRTNDGQTGTVLIAYADTAMVKVGPGSYQTYRWKELERVVEEENETKSETASV